MARSFSAALAIVAGEGSATGKGEACVILSRRRRINAERFFKVTHYLKVDGLDWRTRRLFHVDCKR